MRTGVERTPPCGPVRGATRDQMACFLGIPYAKPLAGAARFLAPEPPEPWSEPRDCAAYGPTAPQPDRAFTLIPEPEEAGEGYLNLNVFAPKDLPAEPLPVLVYIHGGGFFSGCNRSPWFEGDAFVRDGVIVVSPSYRLGVEGFMPIAGAPDNRAILDWVLALEWVRDNIAAFGGDPARVTLSGQSAGAGAVATLMATPLARGLFQRAALFSGSVGFRGSMARAQAFAQRFSAATARPLTVDGLASLTRPELIAGFSEAMPDPEARGPGDGFLRNVRHGIPMQPLPGTETLPQPLAEAFAQGASGDIPALLTTTQDEFVFELEPLGEAVTDADLARVCAEFGLAEAELRAAYPGFSNARLLGQLASDALMRAPMLRMAELRRQAGGTAPSWTAEFKHPSSVALASPLRAAHCLDMPYYFEKLALPSAQKVCGADAPAALGAQMHRAVVDFVSGRGPGWAHWDAVQRTRVWAMDDKTTPTDAEGTARLNLGHINTGAPLPAHAAP